MSFITVITHPVFDPATCFLARKPATPVTETERVATQCGTGLTALLVTIIHLKTPISILLGSGSAEPVIAGGAWRLIMRKGSGRLDKPWKQNEREVARKMGFERSPNTGFGHPDIPAGPFAVEVKARKKLPDWYHEAHSQARRNAGSSTPLVVFCERRQGVKTKRYVSMEFEDWLEWFGPGGWARPQIVAGYKEG